MSMREIISQMESLASHCESMIDKDDPESIWKMDAEALNEAVRKLEGEFNGANAAEVILRIMEKEKVNQKELAERFHTSLSSVQRAVNRLKEDGCIERVGGKRYGYWEIRR